MVSSMPTLYVENVPDDLYAALRGRARVNRRSISAEVLALLGENVPTPTELARRRNFMKRAQKIRSKGAVSTGPFTTAEQMILEDRNR
jgi:plasmid stability protein